MRITAPSWFAAAAAGALVLAAAQLSGATETPFSVLADLASHLSQGDAVQAAAAFDNGMKGYSELEQNIDSLTKQATVLCAIDIVEDTETQGVHKLDLDWYMQIKSQLDNSTERRRERVQAEMREIRGHWKIISISPIRILDPVQVH